MPSTQETSSNMVETSTALPAQTAPSSDTTASAEQKTSAAHWRWPQLLIPSVVDLFFAALLLGISCGPMGRALLRDSDIGWHIRNGEQILLTHAIPRSDSFSSTMSGHTWYAWEWLYDAVIAAIHHVFMLNGVVFFSALIIAASFAVTLRFTLRHGANLVITLFLLILSLGASGVHFLARPHVLSWVLAVIWFELLDSAASHRAVKHLLWLPLVMLLWVNLHGGFVLGFALLAMYLIGGAVQYIIEREQRHSIARWLQQLAAVTALCLAVSFINPYTYHLHVHIYRYLSDSFLMNQISEFRSPDFHGAAQQCFAVLLIIVILALAAARPSPSPPRVLVLLLACYSGLYATRNLPTSALLITLVVAPLLSKDLAESQNRAAVSWLRGFISRLNSFGTRMQALQANLRGHAWIVLVFAIGLWACWRGGRLGSVQLINASFDDKRFPVEAVDFIARHNIREPIFSLDYWGGYLIYRLYPTTKVVDDDRHDLYGDQFIKDYLKIVLVQPTYEKQLDDLHVQWILVPRWSPLANVLRLTPNWTEIHEDGTAALFQRQHNS